MIAKGGWSNCG